MTKRKVTLFKIENCNTKISYIRMQATITEIWNLIDSLFISVKSSCLTRFIRCVMSLLKTTETTVGYKLLCIEHREDTKNYKKQQSAFNEIIKYIQTTILSENATFIEKIETHSWNLLTVLKERIAFFDDARLYSIKKKYRKLCDESRE